MARIRSIHPGLFTDEAFAMLGADAQMLLIGLWTESDDQGIFEWKPMTLRMRLRPTKDGHVEPLLAEISAAGCVMKYELAGRQYGAIRNFRKFQRPKKPNAIHPITDDIRTYVALSVASSELDDDEHSEVPNQLPTGGEIAPQMKDEGGRMKDEGKKEKTSAVASRTSPADDSPVFLAIPTNRFETQGEEVPITERFIHDFQEIYPAVDVREQIRAMRGWSISNKDLRKTRKGMTRFINAWLGRQQNSGVSRGTANQNRQKPATAHDKFFAAAASFISDQIGAGEAETGDDSGVVVPISRPLLQA